MFTIKVSRARYCAVRVLGLRNLQEVTLVAVTGKLWTFVIDDTVFAQGLRRPHDWIMCRDAQGAYVELHIDERWRVDRVAVFQRRHPNSRPQLELFAS